VACKDGPDGSSWRRTVIVRAGERRTISGLVVEQITVIARLSRGDAVRIDGRPARGKFRVKPGPHRVDLVSQGRVLPGGRWVTFPFRACTLVDQPTLRCR
jgi:hypothetical protein